MVFRLIPRWWILLVAVCAFGGDFRFLNGAAADEVKTPEPPILPAVTTSPKPAEPAGNIGSNTVSAGLISAPVTLSADRVRRIQVVQRVEPEIVQIFPNLRPAGLD